ncbi:conjugal transfer protein TraF (plasmid) [Vibrio sp. SS-MA-C1-2]|uniref:conjugal transfer protein TraF n=1 Tax=Vibrio sp. SS-MA-C1-2 TaxID=2908646 RepID=UPI001F211850|nr:conjugal transfer protein TraF [Vibrio sp. SS-MA-C1-2]UJF20209.1 conjugal transfer protein TraF [Vibrio sp. SS-MA-C1-2]
MLKPLLISTLLFSSSLLASDAYINSNDSPGGWHFYVDPKKEEEVKKEKPTPPPPSASPATTSAKPLSSEWIRANWTVFRDAAIDNPSPENIRRLRNLQRVIMDKAQVFSEEFMKDVAQNSMLDETVARPTSSFGIIAHGREAYLAKKPLIEKIGQQAGFWFFYESDCPYCNKQAPLMKSIENMGIKTQAISIDGPALSSGLFADNFIVDRKGKYKELGVSRVPALFLVTHDGEFIIPVSQGILTQNEILEMTFKQSKAAGLITAEEYDSIADVKSMQRYTEFNEENIDVERLSTDPRYFNQLMESGNF